VPKVKPRYKAVWKVLVGQNQKGESIKVGRQAKGIQDGVWHT